MLLHRYGGDRSWLFNLGVKINETTNHTILWPELRGHGEDPPISWTSLGARESDDVLAAIEFLKTLKSENQKQLVGESFGLYGVELGAYSALKAASQDNQIKVLVLDSIVRSPDDLLNTAVSDCVAIDNSLVHSLSRTAMRVYMLGRYRRARSRAIWRSLFRISACCCFPARKQDASATRRLRCKAVSRTRVMYRRESICR